MLMLVLLLILNGILGVLLVRQRRFAAATEHAAYGLVHVGNYRLLTDAPSYIVRAFSRRTGVEPPPRQTFASRAAVQAGHQPSDAYVLIIHGTERPGQCFPIGRRRLIIGRDANADIPCHDLLVSRRHASIWKLDEQFIVRDELSTNGLRINGRRVTQRALADNDVIGIGPVLMIFYTGHPIPSRCAGQDASRRGR